MSWKKTGLVRRAQAVVGGWFTEEARAAGGAAGTPEGGRCGLGAVVSPPRGASPAGPRVPQAPRTAPRACDERWRLSGCRAAPRGFGNQRLPSSTLFVESRRLRLRLERPSGPEAWAPGAQAAPPDCCWRWAGWRSWRASSPRRGRTSPPSRIPAWPAQKAKARWRTTVRTRARERLRITSARLRTCPSLRLRKMVRVGGFVGTKGPDEGKAQLRGQNYPCYHLEPSLKQPQIYTFFFAPIMASQKEVLILQGHSNLNKPIYRSCSRNTAKYCSGKGKRCFWSK